MKSHLEPLEPAVFCTAVVSLFKKVNEHAEEIDGRFDVVLGGSIFFQSYFEARDKSIDASETILCNRSTFRLLALTRLLHTDDEKLQRVIAKLNRGFALHPGLIEAAALASVSEEGHFDKAEILALAEVRIKEIESLQRLFR